MLSHVSVHPSIHLSTPGGGGYPSQVQVQLGGYPLPTSGTPHQTWPRGYPLPGGTPRGGYLPIRPGQVGGGVYPTSLHTLFTFSPDFAPFSPSHQPLHPFHLLTSLCTLFILHTSFHTLSPSHYPLHPFHILTNFHTLFTLHTS